MCDGYLASIARSGRRPNTRRAYFFELVDFGEWLLRHRVWGISALAREHIEGWQDGLATRAAPRTQQVAATALRGLLKWAADQELGPNFATLWLRVAHPRVPRLEPRPIPAGDLGAILRALGPAAPATLHRLRTRALFFVLFSSGARISEALSLRRGALRDGSAEVIQKGGSTHVLVISKQARQALAEYELRRVDSGQAMFALPDGSELKHADVQDAWDGLCAELGTARFTSHQIRHSTATTMLRNGVDWLVIAKHLGHRGTQTIAGYAAVALESRIDAVAGLDRLLAS